MKTKMPSYFIEEEMPEYFIAEQKSGMPDYFQEDKSGFQPRFEGDQPGWAGVWQDAKGAANEVPSILSQLFKSSKNAPGEISGFAKQLGLNNPFIGRSALNFPQESERDLMRVGQSVAGGLASLFHNGANIPGEIRDYFAEKEILPEKTSSWRIPGLSKEAPNYPEMFGRIGEKPGDSLAEIAGTLAAPNVASVASKIIGSAGKTIGKGVVGGSKLIGSGISSGYEGVKNLKHLPTAISPNKMADEIIGKYRSNKATNSAGYNALTVQANAAGAVPMPNSQAYMQSMHLLPDAERRIMGQYLFNPTFESAHKLEKVLGREVFEKQKTIKRTGRSTALANELGTLKALESRVQNEMLNSLTNVGRNDLYTELGKLNKFYGKNVKAYENNPVFNKYLEGNLTKKDFAEDIGKNKKFRANLGEEHPAVGLRNHLPYSGPATVIGSAYLLNKFFGK